MRTGHFDVETGYTNTTTTGTGGGSSVLYPQPLIRIGTPNPHFDVELGPPSYATTSVGEPTVTGSTDASLGAKLELGYTSNAVWGVNGLITFPTGSSGIFRRKRAVHRKLQRCVYGKLGRSEWPVRSASTHSPV